MIKIIELSGISFIKKDWLKIMQNQKTKVQMKLNSKRIKKSTLFNLIKI